MCVTNENNGKKAITEYELIKEYKQGSILKTKILDINVENEKISLGIKQLTKDKFSSELENVKLGEPVNITLKLRIDKPIKKFFFTINN